MSKLLDDVRAQAAVLADAGANKPRGDATEAERELLRRLGAAMKAEESCFDPAHGFARILGAAGAHGEVRLRSTGEWVIGAAEEDLLGSWGGSDRPSLAELLEAIPKVFASARIGALVDEVRQTLKRE